MMRAIVGPLALLWLAALPVAAPAQYAIKTTDQPAPTELSETIRAEMGDKCVQLVDSKGELLMEVWLCKAVPCKATDVQVQNGLTYAEIPESSLMGSLRVAKQTTDYKKQKIKPGVYTLRLARQPQDGDHMGTAPYGDFFVALPAGEDKKPALLEVKKLQEMSAKSTGSHPGVFLLFPGKEAGPEPKLINKSPGTWVLFFKEPVSIGDKKTSIGIGLTLVGVSESI